MENHADLINNIKRVRHFQNLSLGDLHAIVTAGQLVRFASGQTIFLEGQPCSGMFVLLSGRVHLCKLGPLGQVNIMSVIEPVIMFNEAAVLDGGPNPITAMAVEDCLTWQISHESFQSLLDRIPQVGLSLLRVLAARIRQMIAHYADLSFRTVVGRTAKFLLDISDQGRKPIDRSKCSLAEMANRIATVPEAISRSLNILKTQGAIRVSRTEIAVLSAKKLAALAQIGPELESLEA